MLVRVHTYVVVDVGDALVVAEVGAERPAVGDQENVAFVVGVAASDVELPAQMVVAVGVTVSEGNALTVIATVPLSVQPFASVPVTVYVVLAVGETVTVVPVSDPGIHA